MAGVVAAGQRETAECAAAVLQRGGNAVDAVIAAAAGSWVAEPLLASPGGGGILTVAVPGREPAIIDFFADAPRNTDFDPGTLDFAGVNVDFGSVTQEFHVGRGSVAVPGGLAGLAEAHRRFGTFDLIDLMLPAIRLAKEGVCVSPETALTFKLLWPILSRDPAVVCALTPLGRAPGIGDAVSNPLLADTLTEFGKFGHIPDRVQEGLLKHFGPARGGLITEADVHGYRPVVGEPLAIELGDWMSYTSPAVGGHLVEVILRALAADTPAKVECDEVLRYALASRAGHAERQNLIAPGSTTHISVVDANHGAASVTLTNGEGCGHMIPGTGIQMNNFLGEEDLNPHGFHQHPPGSRLPTMMAPTVAKRCGDPALALGSGGSNRIRTAVGQVLYRVAQRGQSLEDAVHMPRVHAEGDIVWVELGGLAEPDEAVQALRSAFEVVHPFEGRAFFFGGVHAVGIDTAGTTHGVGDDRRGGAAICL